MHGLYSCNQRIILKIPKKKRIMKATFLGKINNFLKSNQFFIMHVLKQKMSVFEPLPHSHAHPPPPPLFSSLGHMVPGPLGNIQ